MEKTGGRCSCGHVKFDIRKAPLFRMLCHCTICQQFNDAPFADIVIYDAASVSRPEPGSVRYDTYTPPPNVQRGVCTECGEPAIEQFKLPLLPGLTLVPAAAHIDQTGLPEPLAHVFYDRRVEDADDSLPKHRGYISSQLAFGKYLLAAKRKK